jgi:lysozyme
MLKLHEGLRLKPYFDTAEPPRLTIGYGHNLTDRGITHAQADAILDDDIFDASAALSSRFPWVEVLDEVRRAVLVDLVFNIGIGGLATFRNTLGLIKDGDYTEASRQMLNSLWASQVGVRAVRLSQMMRSGEWPHA